MNFQGCCEPSSTRRFTYQAGYGLIARVLLLSGLSVCAGYRHSLLVEVSREPAHRHRGLQQEVSVFVP